MSRLRYLIAYDICEPGRLRRVIKVMESFGERLQYSVFLCDLSGQELLAWKTRILGVVKLQEDSVVVINLGLPGSRPLETIGTPRRFPNQGPVIV